jgi:hypothetical protein
MERECWSELSQAICEVAARWRELSARRRRRFVHPTALIVRVHLWSVLHDRPTYWACEAENWDARTRPARLPDQSTMSRRKRSVSFERFMNAIGVRLAGRPSQALLKRVDGKALPIPAHSTDRNAAWGRGAGQDSNGYKLHTIWADRPMPEQWTLTPMNVCEKRMARRMVKRLGGGGGGGGLCGGGGGCSGGGYLLGDSYFDDSQLHDCCAAVNHQLVAPRRLSCRGKGLGHCYQSPHRLRCIDITEPPAQINPFGAGLRDARKQIERDLGNLCSFGGGLAALPPWCRRIWRVRAWVYGKLLINAARIRRRRARIAA